MRLTNVAPGRFTDALIHKTVFGRSDSPPPYSTDHKTAEWLMAAFGLYAEPIRDMEGTTWDTSSGLRWGEVIGYMICRQETAEESGDEETSWQVGIASADIFPLAVCRAVLLLKKVVEDERGHLQ